MAFFQAFFRNRNVFAATSCGAGRFGKPFDITIPEDILPALHGLFDERLVGFIVENRDLFGKFRIGPNLL